MYLLLLQILLIATPPLALAYSWLRSATQQHVPVGGVKIVTPQGVQKPGLDHFCVRVSSLSAIHDKSA